MMIVKVVAFFLMAMGTLVALGFLGVSCPSLQHKAFEIGQTVVSWYKVVAASSLLFIVWAVTKLK